MKLENADDQRDWGEAERTSKEVFSIVAAMCISVKVIVCLSVMLCLPAKKS